MDEVENSSEKIRLQKLLANLGLASRRVIEEMIVGGRIVVNGKVAVLGDKANSEDTIEIDGEKLVLDVETKTFLLNKPLGVISTAKDEQGRQTVVDLIETNLRLFPIGRLDARTSGLILVSNDGDLTYKLTHPKFGVEKKYVTRITGQINNANVEILRNGVELEDGITAKAKVRVLAKKSEETLLEIAIHEGRNRQIRRMIDAIGHEVIDLTRVQIGPISDKNLRPGEYRELTVAEIHSLYSAITGENVARNAEKIN